AFEVGRLRSRAGASLASRARRERFESLEGRRPYESERVVRAALRVLRRHARKKREREDPPRLTTDRKALYASLAKWLVPERTLEHGTVSGKARKGPSSPLFPVNHAAAMARYGMSRLIRRTWCTTKDRRRLRLHGALWAAWKNCVRRRTNRERG